MAVCVAHARYMTKTQTMPDSAITDRPWRGQCATTGKTMEDFREHLTFAAPQAGGELPEWLTRAVVSVCRAYGIKGSADPMYIANVINNQRVGFDASV
jgi:hypothetical protein